MREKQGVGNVLVFVQCACVCAVCVGPGCVTEALRGVVWSRAGVLRMRGPAVGPVGPGSMAVCQQNAAILHSAQQSVQHVCSTGVWGSARAREGRGSIGVRVGAGGARAVARDAGSRAASIGARTMGVRVGFLFC